MEEMAEINFTLRINEAINDKISGAIVAFGEDFGGDEFNHEMSFQDIDSRYEADIPVGICSIHIEIWISSPHRACVDGHLQCGPGRQPTSGPLCVEF